MGIQISKFEKFAGASASAVTRWKSQYRQELKGETPQDTKAMTPEQIKIQSLEKQLREAKKNNDLLKKAAAYFIRDNSALR